MPPLVSYDGESSLCSQEYVRRKNIPCMVITCEGIWYPVKALQTWQAMGLAKRTTAQVVCRGATEEATASDEEQCSLKNKCLETMEREK